MEIFSRTKAFKKLIFKKKMRLACKYVPSLAQSFEIKNIYNSKNASVTLTIKYGLFEKPHSRHQTS